MKAITIFFAAWLVLPASAIAEAPAPDAAARQALAKAQQMLRTLSTERDALKAENAKLAARLDAELNELQSKLSESRNSASAAAKRAATESADLQNNIAAGEARARELEAKLKDTEDRLAGRETELSVCTADNRKLGAISAELLGRYENKGVWDAMVEREPLTQIKRVELENLVQQYDDRIVESLVTAPAARRTR
jgi:chromosome segregation ATPase